MQNSPTIQWLADNKRFIWASERNGLRELYLYDVSGKLLNPITTHTTFEVAGITKVDEAAGVIYYTARSGDNFMKLQLHRVGLNGQGDRRLTDPAFTHTVSIAPDNKLFVDVYQTHDAPPATRVVDMNGKVVAELAKSDLTRFKENGLQAGRDVHLQGRRRRDRSLRHDQLPDRISIRRRNTRCSRRSTAARQRRDRPRTSRRRAPTTEYGFLIVSVSSRSAPGRGKKLLDQIYMKLGIVEMDDMAAGIRSLWSRPYVDKGRVGIYGTSYGGYTSALSILKHPDV